MSTSAARALAGEIRRRLGPVPELRDHPLVSIVVVSRDGVDHLRRLIGGLSERTSYPSFELIVVDNGSSDGSLELLRAADVPFPIAIVANPHNESFSDANNQGAEVAAGELLLFLNNDAEPFEPAWLHELVGCLAGSRPGIVGPTLIQPDHRGRIPCGYAVHQRGIRARDHEGMLAPDFRDQHADPLGEGFGEPVEAGGISAACLLIERAHYERIGGFTHGYLYGGEDVDLALKARTRGITAACSGRSFLIHEPNSTLSAVPTDERRAWLRGNRRLFWERWGPRLRREYELDRLAGGGLWAAVAASDRSSDGGEAPPARSQLEALGFCLRGPARADAERGGGSDVNERGLLASLGEGLARLDRRCAVLEGGRVDDLLGLNYDVAVNLRGPTRFVLRPAQLNVLWCVSHLNAVTPIECSRYDLVVTGSRELAGRLRDEGVATPVRLLEAAQDDGHDARALVAAVEDRAREIGFQTRIDGSGAASSSRSPTARSTAADVARAGIRATRS